MPSTWLLAAFLAISVAAVPWSCLERTAQPPAPDEPTPEPAPTRAPPPDEPTEPPELEPPSSPPDEHGVPTPDPSAPCCYTNPAYAGVCEVRPMGDETCASILEYLNNPRSVGKTYCNSTDIRGGWEPMVCE
jgi:hypothetical protein